MATTILLDGNNLVHRAKYAAFSSKKDSGTEVFLRMVGSYVSKFGHDIHVFWDSKKQSWRREIIPEYKAQRQDLMEKFNEKHNTDVRKELNNIFVNAARAFAHIGIKQYILEEAEADDLINAYVHIHNPKDMTIISSDSDLDQIIYRHENVKIWSPNTKSFRVVPRECPVIKKALIGDKSDNLIGIKGIGPKRARTLCEDIDKLKEFLLKNELEDQFTNMLKVVDLDLCQNLEQNKKYVEKKSMSETKKINASKELSEVVYKEMTYLINKLGPKFGTEKA